MDELDKALNPEQAAASPRVSILGENLGLIDEEIEYSSLEELLSLIHI